MALFLSLVLWGGFSLIYYIGVPVHGETLMSDSAQKAVSATCGETSMLCRGIKSLLPFVEHSVGRWFFGADSSKADQGFSASLRTGAFFWYILLSLLVYGAYAGWRFFMEERKTIRFALRPWHFLALFTACLWLMFTTLSNGLSSPDFPMRRVVEPTAEVYTNVGEGSLRELQNNFNQLKERGCLVLLRESAPGVPGLYDLKQICIQGAFFSRVFSQVFVPVVLFFQLLVLGSAVLWLIGLRPRRVLIEAVLSVGLGAGAWIALLWFIAVLGLFTANVGWVLLVTVPVLLYRNSLRWLRIFVSHRWEIELPLWHVSVLLTWLLISYLAFNFLTVIRPFPIGWDDLGSYLNRPRLLVSYGHIIHSMATFQWEYLTSLGFLLFGYDSVFGATASMIINWSAGLFAAMVVFAFGNEFLGRNRGILAALLYYSLPLVGHFSFADMKIDNALFAVGGLSMLAAFIAFFPPMHEEGKDPALPEAEPEIAKYFSLSENWRWILLAGLYAGFGFALKPTSVMVLMAVLAVMFAVTLHWSAFIAAVFLAFAAFSFQGIFSIQDVYHRITGGTTGFSAQAFMFVCLLLAVAIFVFSLRHLSAIRRMAATLGVFIAAFIVVISPWILNNNFAGGNYGIPRLEMGLPNRLTPSISLNTTAPPAGTVVPPSNAQPVRALPEELKLDSNNATCKPTGAVEELDRYWGFNTGFGHYLTLPWRSVMNLDSAGYYVTTIPALLLAVLIFLLPAVWTRKGRWLRWLVAATLFIVIEWMFLANGIPWYGMGMFLGLMVALEALIVYAPDKKSRIAVSTLIAFSLLIAFGMRFWQFEQQRNLLEYPVGKITASALSERTIPWYDDIRAVVMERHETMPERPYLYRVGTFIPYFIPKNLEVIGVTDHQLDVFNCLYQERNAKLTVERLKALGFNSIVFDTNTSTIERDANGSLHKKVQEFIDFVNHPESGLQVLISDTQAGIAFIVIP